MAINCYTGLMGSGKTYEVVLSIIIPAVCQGRRVITNISGIDSDAIRAYCCEKFDIPLDKLGHVVIVTNDEVMARDFFPTMSSHADDSSVMAGDLIAIDEAYKIWGQDCKIHNEHKVFFREHRHYVHPDTGVACELVLMTQDIGDLHRILKVVIEQSFRCHKAKGIGRDNLYTITMWEGWKQYQKNIVKDWTQTYKPEIFPLYKSYAGETQGKEVASDKRQNILNDKRLLFKLGFLLLACAWGVWHLFHFFSDKIGASDKKDAAVSAASKPGSATAVSNQPLYSPDWRIVGVVDIDGIRQMVLAGTNGLRVDQAIYYKGAGLGVNGAVDGKKVTRFSGPVVAGVTAPPKKEGMLP